MIKPTHSRREVFGNFAALFAGAASARAQGSSPNLPPREELVNTFEFEDVAKLRLSEEAYATIAGSGPSRGCRQQPVQRADRRDCSRSPDTALVLGSGRFRRT